jgi:undecaprenyl-diphosphatase
VLAVDRVLRSRRTVGADGGRMRAPALVVLSTGSLLLGALALLQRQDDALLRVDRDVAAWAQEHATHLSTRVITFVTDLGSTPVVPVLGVLLVLLEWRRLPNRYLAPFLIVTVLGDQLLTVLVKGAVDRARPALNPIAASLGPAFPSGHASTAASFYAAAALILSRGRTARASSLIAGAAIAIIAAVATSRVFLDLHWVSDVIGGIALGWSWCALCALALRGRLFSFRAPP